MERLPLQRNLSLDEQLEAQGRRAGPRSGSPAVGQVTSHPSSGTAPS
jgi:hypothetical protein